ncbi:hypothetical protein KKA94_00705 [Patescibacteria group bacterium]|nr:hypothetical protein [Patescibacteria group bacterium]
MKKHTPIKTIIFTLFLTMFFTGCALVSEDQTNQNNNKNKNLNTNVNEVVNENINVQEEIKENINQLTDTEIDSNNWQTYFNKKYKYEIKYPDNFFLKEVPSGSGQINFNYILLRDKNGEETDWLIEINTAKDREIPEDTSELSFDEFIEKKVKELCAADGVNGSRYCTDIISQEDFINSNNFIGQKFYLKEIYEDFTKEETEIAEKIKGPIFVYDISQETGNSARALFVELTEKGEEESINETILQELVNSFQFNKD